ncbi:SDR family oxidoreductase [Parvicella tangerina]|uniref:Ketoacyl reductase n=1 Tax=Parvicella tangerina TaxID=2829795 RepID=A0A916JQQ6_9FLAO|nr:SDR family oxidoreductase [Parvicella tangerina]CAG5086341.1 Putative ketoacyl reductase [Parvicella tangerina]
MNIDLTDKTALVCGSTQGIGKATAEQLAKMGANVVLMARNEQKLVEVKRQLDTSKGQQHFHLKADFNFPPEVRIKVESFIEEFMPIDILVNNTGGPAAGPAIDAKVDEYIHAFNMHLVSNQSLAQTVVPGMKERGYGRIINVISTSVKQPLNGLGVSNTIRGAVANWAKTLANELGEFGITVNNVLPGATNTSRLKQIIENKAAKSGKSEDEVAATMTGQVPMKRFAEPFEVANGIAFLASPAASYINGVNLPVDGGRTKSL